MAMGTTTTLVVGATGATGKHVVLQLLQQSQNVRAIVRSKQRLLDSIDDIAPHSSAEYANRLEITEASLLDMSDGDVKKAASGCDAVVSCLGHNVSFKGLFGHPRRLVRDGTRKLYEALESTQVDETKSKAKFIVMGTVAVPNPAGDDRKPTFGERIVLFLLRYLLPPHRDNELTASYIFTKTENPRIEWTVVRPTDLVDGMASKYELFEKRQEPLFGGESVATRANVAKCMVDMIRTESLWETWKFKFPVIHDLN